MDDGESRFLLDRKLVAALKCHSAILIATRKAGQTLMNGPECPNEFECFLTFRAPIAATMHPMCTNTQKPNHHGRDDARD